MDEIEVEQLRKLARLAPVGMAKVAVDGAFLWVSPGYERLTGYSGAELLKLKWQDITPPHDRETDQEMVNEVMSGARSSYEMLKSYNRKNNGLIQVHLTVSGWYGDDGRLDHFLVVATPREPRTILSTSADKRELTISTKGSVQIERNWKWVLTATFVALSAITGWLVTANTAIADVQRNGDRIQQIEATLAEILRRLPAKE